MNKTEKMPERPRKHPVDEEGYWDTMKHISQYEEYADYLESFCAKQVERIKELDDQRSIFASEQSRQQRVIISLRSKIKLLEGDNDILRDDASKKLLDYLTMRNKAERLEEEKREAVIAFEDIIDYWNKDNNDKAMEDACWHSIEVAESFLSTQDKGETEK